MFSFENRSEHGQSAQGYGCEKPITLIGTMIFSLFARSLAAVGAERGQDLLVGSVGSVFVRFRDTADVGSMCLRYGRRIRTAN